MKLILSLRTADSIADMLTSSAPPLLLLLLLPLPAAASPAAAEVEIRPFSSAVELGVLLPLPSPTAVYAAAAAGVTSSAEAGEFSCWPADSGLATAEAAAAPCVLK
jgi:hypothetical protein